MEDTSLAINQHLVPTRFKLCLTSRSYTEKTQNLQSYSLSSKPNLFSCVPPHNLLKKNILFTELVCTRQRIGSHVLSDKHMIHMVKLLCNLLVISYQQSVPGVLGQGLEAQRCQSFTRIIIHCLVLNTGWGTKYICLLQGMLVCIMSFVQLCTLKKLKTDCPIRTCVHQNTEQMTLYQVHSAFTNSNRSQSYGSKHLKLTPQLGNKASDLIFGQLSQCLLGRTGLGGSFCFK